MIFSACNTKNLYLLAGTYTGTGSKGIYVYQFDPASGKATLVSHTDTTINPSFVIANGDFVYAVNETNGDNPGSVSAFSFDKKTGKLTFLNKQATGGDDPCHLAINKDGKWLAVANYSGGSTSVFSLGDDGSISPLVQLLENTGSSINKERQEKSHVHEVVFSNDDRYLFAPDLGQDKILIYDFDGKKEHPALPAALAFLNIEPGSGPRHFTFDAKENFAYLVAELTGMVHVYSYRKGQFSEIQEIPAYAPEYTGSLDAAEILISPDGKFLYSSHRGDMNHLTIFSVDKDSGKLTLIGFQSTLGKAPRNFTIDPSGQYLLAANQNSDNIVIFKRDKATGLLNPTGVEISLPKPVSLQWLPQ